jgi:sugar phosphate isomerase/epimerase
MPRTRSRRSAPAEKPASTVPAPLDPGLLGRLGIDQPVGWWPTTPRLKSYEAAGFSHLQVRMPPRETLGDSSFTRAHASALRDKLKLTGLELVLHAPDDLLAGSGEADQQLVGALEYAGVCGAKLLVYHGARLPLATPRLDSRLEDEARSLRKLLALAGAHGVRIAIENLAPVYPGPEFVCHNVLAIDELVRRLGSEHVGICLDVGHANITAGIAGCDLVELIEPVLERVILFHVHDNFGARVERPRAGGIEPLRLDLHLAPGAGNVPWADLAPLLLAHEAPLQLEVHPAARPEPANLAILTREVLRGGWEIGAEPAADSAPQDREPGARRH